MVLLYISYFFLYVPQQQSLLHERGFRILEEYGMNVHEKQKYFDKHIENYGAYYVIRDFLNTGTKDKVRKKKDGFKRCFADHHEVIKGLDQSIGVCRHDASETEDLPIFAGDVQDGFNYIIEMKGVAIVMDPTCQDTMGLKDTIENLFDSTYSIKIPVNTLMDMLKFDRMLENIVLLDSENVIHNSAGNVIQDITNPAALHDSIEDHQGGIVEKFTIRGEDKQLLVLPFDWLGKKFYLAGIIPDAELRKKTRVSSQVLVIVSGILFLVLIAMPVIKVILINRQERLNLRDAYAANLSMILGTSLLVIIAIGWLKNELVDTSLETKRVEAISDTLYSNLKADLDWVMGLKSDILHKKDTTKADSLYSVARKGLLDPEAKYLLLDSNKFLDQRQVNEIFTIKANGFMHKAVTRTPFSELVPINLGDRMYFRNALFNDKAWVPRGGENGFFIESIKSYNTTRQEAATSFHLTPKDSLNAPVLGITSKLPSLYSQVLPPDIDFMVVNRSGKVLFHSKKNKNLHENFLEECGHEPGIVGAMHLGIEKNTRINYNEQHWLARIRPIEDTPLYHITLLNQETAHANNARIMLFTFYFALLTLVWISLSLVLMRRPGFRSAEGRPHAWSLSWLVYQPGNYMRYIALTTVFLFLITFQVAGMFFIGSPMAMFVYQLIFITLSGFAALFVLARKDAPSDFRGIYWFELAALGVAVVLVLFWDWLLQSPGAIWFPLGSIALLLVLLYIGNNKTVKEKIRQMFEKSPGADVNNRTDKDAANPGTPGRRLAFHGMIFAWLICLAVVPTMQYYRSVSIQEEKIGRRINAEHLARLNIAQSEEYRAVWNKPWYRRIQGTGIDGMSVRNLSQTAAMAEDTITDLCQWFYCQLPDPVTTDKFRMSYLQGSSSYDEWVVVGDTLQYSRSGETGLVEVISPVTKDKALFGWTIVIIVVILLFILFFRLVYRYVIEHIFDTRLVNSEAPQLPAWNEVLADGNNHRILLNTLNDAAYQAALEKYIEDEQVLANKEGCNQQIEFTLVDGADLVKTRFTRTSIFSDACRVIWISGLEHVIPRVDQHGLLIDRIVLMTNQANGTVVVVMPYDFDYINELYDDYLEKNSSDDASVTLVAGLRPRWESLFRSYYKYVGNIVLPGQEENGAEDDSAQQGVKEVTGEPGHQYIWSSLTRQEKLILYDLVEDGMLNLKNQFLIHRLIIKGLVIPGPYPDVYDDSFSAYIRDAVKPESAKALEQKLGLKGRWRTMRYLILLILIPMAMFVLISQGFSFQKAVGILGGVLATLTGIVKMFDSSVFRQG